MRAGGRVSLGAVRGRLRQSCGVCLDQVIESAGYSSYSQAARFSPAVFPLFRRREKKPLKKNPHSCRTSFWTS